LDQIHEEPPVVVVGRMSPPVPAPRQVDDLAKGIQLALARGFVSYAHRADATVALQVGKRLHLETPLAADPVDDLQIVGVPAGAALDEAPEGVRLIVVSELGERSDAERRVAHPGIPVVPVAIAV